MGMNHEQKRLATFIGWPHKSIHPKELAENGFYFTKKHDQVRCSFCSMEIEHLDHTNIYQEHRSRSPDCPVVRRCDRGPRTMDTCGIYGITPENQFPDESEPWKGRKQRRRPEYPGYAHTHKRVESYLEWPVCMTQKVEDLVEAGFFYTGRGDKVICFHCGLGLNRWENTDIPWVEHAKWSPDCEFLVTNKGEEFVKECKSQCVKIEPAVKNGQSKNGHMEEEIKLGDSVACKICFNKPVEVAFQPCGHTSCINCAFALSKCHICRAPIQKHIKLYI